MAPAASELGLPVLGTRLDNVHNVLKVGKSARHLSPTQLASDVVKALPAAAEAVEDPFSSSVELVDPIDSAPVSCDVGRQPPIPGCLASVKEGLESGLRPLQEVQEPLGEGFPAAVFPAVPRGIVRGEGLEGVGVDLGSGPSHGFLSHGGVSWAFADEPHLCSPSQVGDEELGKEVVVGNEPVGYGGGSRGDRGCGNLGS